MRFTNRSEPDKLKRFDEVPDIIDPNFSNYLQDLIKKQFGNVSWHIKMYIADDGTGSIEIVSKDDSHGQSYRKSNLVESTEIDDLSDDDIHSWNKRVLWRWDEKHPREIVSFETINTDREFGVEQRILYQYDMSNWKDTLVYGEVKESNTTTESKDENGEQNVKFGWQRGSRGNDTSMQNIREDDQSAESISTDEISVTFSQAYDIWMNKLRPRLNIDSESDVPRPFDCKGKSNRKLLSMIEHFDFKLLEIKEHRGADAANIDNYVQDFSEIRESYRYMDKYLDPQPTYSGDDFDEDWMEFKNKMDVLIELLKDYSSRF